MKQKHLKNLKFSQKRSAYKYGARNGMVAIEISKTRKYPNALHWQDTIDILGISLE